MRRNNFMGLAPFIMPSPFDEPFFGLVPFDEDKPKTEISKHREMVPHMAVDVKEEDGKYVVEVDVPGMDKENISLNIEDDVLTISYDKQEEEKEEKDDGYIVRERKSHVSVKRQVRLADADEESATAKMEDGVLTITVEKTVDKDTSKKIEIL